MIDNIILPGNIKPQDLIIREYNIKNLICFKKIAFYFILHIIQFNHLIFPEDLRPKIISLGRTLI